LAVDNFYSVEGVDFGKRQLRMEISNALAFKLNSFMAFSTKYIWFYYNSMEDDENYRDSQVLMALDLVTDFKIY
jgi:hypothetical protein